MDGIFELWSPSVAELTKAIELVEGYFGKQWLKEEIRVQSRKPKDWHKKFSHHLKPEPHPILYSYLRATDNLERLKQNPDTGFDRETLELISFSDVLRKIKKINIVDIDGKPIAIRPWSKLKTRLKDKDEFRQASYEMQVAAALKRSGFKVCFVQESTEGEKTPDLLIREGQDSIYVECKFRTQTKREQRYDVYFKEFYSRSMNLMFRLGKFYSICVEWLKDPTIKYVESEIARLEKRILNGEEGCFETENAKIWLKQLASRGQVFEGSYDVNVGEYLSDDEHADIIIAHAEAGIFDGVIKHKNPTLVMFRNISYLDDVVDSIVSLLNKAYSQIPEKGPGIVFLETHLGFENQRIKESLQALKRKLVGKLNIIGRVNVVILTKSSFTQRNIKVDGKDATVIARTVESTVINNEKPRSPISQDILDKIHVLKYY